MTTLEWAQEIDRRWTQEVRNPSSATRGLFAVAAEVIGEAVAEERKRCAQIAWDAQMNLSYSPGGTAIGNAIEGK